LIGGFLFLASTDLVCRFPRGIDVATGQGFGCFGLTSQIVIQGITPAITTNYHS
jgi:hypothetical protein